MQKNKIFSCKQLEIGYDHKPLTTVDLELNAGDILSISGSNGSGKSTFIKTILNKVSAMNGDFQWQVDISEISYLPQISHEDHFFSYTIAEILKVYGVDELWEDDLSDEYLSKKWNEASGGEKQKALILTKLTTNVRVLILDEPLNHLDKQNKSIVLKVLAKISQKNEDLVMIIVSHQALGSELKINRKLQL